MAAGETNMLDVQIVTLLEAQVEKGWQAFIIDLLQATHGIRNIQDIRSVKDKGADALVHSQKCCIACYGPSRTPDMATFRRKAKGDYISYQNNWKKQYPGWQLWVNWEPSPDQIQWIDQNCPEGQIVGIKRVQAYLKAIPWHAQRHLLEELGIDADLIGRKLLQPLLDDLANERAPKSSPVDYHKRAPVIERKVKENYSQEEVEVALERIKISFEYQGVVEELLRQYENKELERIKRRVIQDFDDTSHNLDFHDRFIQLCRHYDDRYNKVEDEPLSDYIRALVLYMFVQCHIGQEPDARRGV